MSAKRKIFLCHIMLSLFIIISLPATSIAGKYIKLDNRGIQLYYEEAGEGTPIVFIPGWTMTTEFFSRQKAYFANSKEFRFITFDPRGQGRSSTTLEGNSYSVHATDLKMFIDALGLKDIILVGWSWGVLTQWYYVRDNGIDNLKAMIVIDGTPKPLREKEDEWADGPVKFMEGTFNGVSFNRYNMAAAVAEWMLMRKPTPEEAWIVDHSLRTPGYVANLLLLNAIFADFTKEAKEVDGKIPILTVLRQDQSESATKWIKANTPHTEAFTLGGHMMFYTHADAFNTKMDEFLNKVKR